MKDLIGYDDIIENSMRSVIYESFKRIEKTGLPGKHYFMLTFLTRFPGVSLSPKLIEKFSEEMTIAIQHQYKSISVERDKLHISLSFNGKYEKLVIPYKAVTSFSDPSMNFTLRFSVNYEDLEDVQDVDSNQGSKNFSSAGGGANIDLSAKVISIDAFRKNRNDNPSDNS
jgi:uncharacterized protein